MFLLRLGIRQKFPLLPLFSNIVLKFLEHKARRNKGHVGIHIGKEDDIIYNYLYRKSPKILYIYFRIKNIIRDKEDHVIKTKG